MKLPEFIKNSIEIFIDIQQTNITHIVSELIIGFVAKLINTDATYQFHFKVHYRNTKSLKGTATS